jgi:DNA-binding beta-propeller fold protein YncE
MTAHGFGPTRRRLMQAGALALGGALAAPRPRLAARQATPAAEPATTNRTSPLDFEGRYLVSISDADMLASAYIDGNLGPREGQDALSVIPLGGDPRELRAHEVEVSNSVAGPPTAVAVSPDGRWAFVVETFAPAAPDAQVFGDLPVGTRLTSVDLADPAEPRVHAAIDVGARPESVSVHPAGDLLAVTLYPPADGSPAPGQLAFVPVAGGDFGTPRVVAVSGIEPTDRTSHAEWHPSGEFLALTAVDIDRVVFLRATRSGDGVVVEPWGEPTVVGKYPFLGRFTPDGRFFLSCNLYWGSDVEGFWTEAPRGDVAVVGFAATAAADGAIRHPLVSRAETGISPEGIAISPDGRLVVTTNLERSYLPYDDERITWFSSLTLLELDPDSGTLTRLEDALYDGILPEAATFDASGRFVAVATYDHFDDRTPGGSIDFWRVVADPTHPTPRLVQTTTSVPVTRGVHSLVLVP